MQKIQIKPLRKDFRPPTKANSTDAAYDLTAYSINDYYTKGGDEGVEYGLGFAAAIPDGYCALLFPRSSQTNTDMTLANCVGVIDSTYRGEWKARFKNTMPTKMMDDGLKPLHYQIGDRVAQMMIVPVLEIGFDIVDELSDTNRGVGGFGSTGK